MFDTKTGKQQLEARLMCTINRIKVQIYPWGEVCSIEWRVGLDLG